MTGLAQSHPVFEDRPVEPDHSFEPVVESGPGRPTVSVVLPTLNERSFIRDALDSLLAQDYAPLVEILVCDGGSTDGTREIVKASASPVRLLDNTGVTAAAGMNLGIRSATGEVICRADAHTLYATDYVSRCVDALLSHRRGQRRRPDAPAGHDAVRAGGGGRHVVSARSGSRSIPLLGRTAGRRHRLPRLLAARDAARARWVRRHLLAVGRRGPGAQLPAPPARWSHRSRPVDPFVVLPTARRRPALARQYSNYGVAKASTLAKHRTLPTWRPLAPALLVAASVSALLTQRGWRRWALPAVHAGVLAGGAARAGRAPGVAPHRAFAVLEICHWSYGVGFWRGVAPYRSSPPVRRSPARTPMSPLPTRDRLGEVALKGVHLGLRQLALAPEQIERAPARGIRRTSGPARLPARRWWRSSRLATGLRTSSGKE